MFISFIAMLNSSFGPATANIEQSNSHTFPSNYLPMLHKQPLANVLFTKQVVPKQASKVLQFNSQLLLIKYQFGFQIAVHPLKL